MYIDFYLQGKHSEKLYITEKYQTWVPIMLQNNVFKDYNIRYIFGSYETYALQTSYKHNNVVNKGIDEIARSVYFAMKKAEVGTKPTVLVCHSMGGLICKKVLALAKGSNDEHFLSNIKGVVFFSTPHFGSDVVLNILKNVVGRYRIFFNLFQTTSNEYGLYNDDIFTNLAKM